MQNQKIIIICGPTGSGKSGIAMDLCRKYNGAMISADSRQVYSQMDIGTGKELPQDGFEIKKKKDRYIVNGIDVYGYDIVKPNEEFSVSIFEDKVFKEYLPKILAQGKIPFLVGGTGFYIKSIIDGIETANIPPDSILRNKLEKLFQEKGVGALWQELEKIDVKKAQSIDAQNPRRIIRAIEIAKAQKNEIPLKPKNIRNFEPLFIGINWERKALYNRVDKRVDKMFEQGLILEISNLLHQGYSWDLSALNTIGYIELKPFFEEKALLSSCVERLKFSTHAYIRRQLTWFNKDKRIRWFVLDNSFLFVEMIAYIDYF